jgi:hypothetical protein
MREMGEGMEEEVERLLWEYAEREGGMDSHS